MISKKTLLLMLIFMCVMLYAQPKTLYQFLENWPAGYDTTGKHWVVYNLNKAKTHFVTETSIASQTTTTLWMAQIGNFNGGVNPWNPGDTLVAFGSIDTAYMGNPAGYGDNPNHCGFYWLFSDTINSATPESWQPADTIRSMPKPLAAQVGENIELSITNPVETTSGITVYGVLGYWIWADTTGSGTPNRYDKEVAFVPVQGGSGETTIYSHPIAGNYEAGQTVYWAYKLIGVPDTTATYFRQTYPGYATYYFSQNSNPIVVGIEESQILNPKSQIPELEIYPNPFRQITEIRLQITDDRLQIKIYDASGRVVKTFSDNLCNRDNSVQSVGWDGRDDNGQLVPQGIYFVTLKTDKFVEIKKVVLMR
jgi:hypothetical protein